MAGAYFVDSEVIQRTAVRLHYIRAGVGELCCFKSMLNFDGAVKRV